MGLLAAVAIAAALLAGASVRAAAAPPGCDPSRPAVAFHPGALVPIQPQPPGGPIPCGMTTGLPAVESRMAASATGVVFNAATGKDGVTGVASSTDNGATWKVTGDNGGIDDNLAVDGATGRIFWIKFKEGAGQPQNHEVAYSDDGGQRWTRSTTGACCIDGENSRLITAPPPRGGARPAGYPNVVYVCSHTSLLGGIEYAAGARVCSKSLDGGKTFTLTGVLFSKPVPQHRQCLPYGEYFGASEGAYPEAGANGSLYVLLHCGDGRVVSSFLMRSDDEAATWTVLRSIPYGDELRVDGENNLYLARTDPVDDAPLLRVSRDEGRTWSPAMQVAPPGVRAHSHHPEDSALQTGIAAPYWPQEFTSYQWFMDVREPGHIALNFYGQRPGTKEFDAYISESRDALDPNPTFWAGAVNPPSKPMTTGAFADEYSSGNEHNGLSFAPDGSPWGSFTDGTNGYAGRLYWPPPEPTSR